LFDYSNNRTVLNQIVHEKRREVVMSYLVIRHFGEETESFTQQRELLLYSSFPRVQIRVVRYKDTEPTHNELGHFFISRSHIVELNVFSKPVATWQTSTLAYLLLKCREKGVPVLWPIKRGGGWMWVQQAMYVMSGSSLLHTSIAELGVKPTPTPRNEQVRSEVEDPPPFQ
jgi:hypothetical protein